MRNRLGRSRGPGRCRAPPPGPARDGARPRKRPEGSPAAHMRPARMAGLRLAPRLPPPGPSLPGPVLVTRSGAAGPVPRGQSGGPGPCTATSAGAMLRIGGAKRSNRLAVLFAVSLQRGGWGWGTGSNTAGHVSATDKICSRLLQKLSVGARIERLKDDEGRCQSGTGHCFESTTRNVAIRLNLREKCDPKPGWENISSNVVRD